MSEVAELSRQPIRLLSVQVANQIAAGEVVERPASVLKEMLENSIDAKATRIEIELINSGFSLIRVTDNGTGIPEEELALSLTRHATSKISVAADLEKIGSMGFRGEALASIASVSKLRLVSKTSDQMDAYQCRVQADAQIEILKAAHLNGTTVEVRDLFYNVPVRRKFLKSVKTEFECLDSIVKKMALSHYGIEFILIHNQKKVRIYPKALTKVTKLARIQKILGTGFVQNAYELDFEQNGLKLSGYFGKSESALRHSDHQYFFVNQRPIRDKVILHAIKTAMHEKGMILEGQYPAYVLYLELSPAEVDVNVHPTKQEVRFKEARLIHDFIHHCVTLVLDQDDVAIETTEIKLERHSSPLAKSMSTPIYFEKTEKVSSTISSVLRFENYILFNFNEQLIIIDINKAKILNKQALGRALLFPIVFSETVLPLGDQVILKNIGFDFTQNIKGDWLITHMPKDSEAIVELNKEMIAGWFK